jgi:predicted nucleic acid-binding protein
MTALVFVDTNILLYSLSAVAPAKRQVSEEWLQRLWRERSGRISMQVANEYYHNLTRKSDPGLAPDKAWAEASAYFAWQPLVTDESVLTRAFSVQQRYQLSWWDSLIVAAAQLQSCTMLLTEDLHDGAQFGDVRVCNPFKHKVSEALATYQVDMPAVAPLHRPRGRPRKAA